MTTYDPTPAQVQWLTLADRLQLERDLADLPGLFDILETNYFALISRGDKDPDDRSIRYPIATAVADLVDRREKDGPEFDPEGMADLARRANARRLGVQPTLQSWVVLAEGEMLTGEIEHRDPVVDDHATVTTAAGWLLAHIEWITGQQWVGELAGEVRAIVRDLDALGINFDGPNHQACLSAEAIAETREVSRATIYRWWKAGLLTDVGKDAVDGKRGVRLFIVREVDALLKLPPWERVSITPKIDRTDFVRGAWSAGASVTRKRHMKWGTYDTPD